MEALAPRIERKLVPTSVIGASVSADSEVRSISELGALEYVYSASDIGLKESLREHFCVVAKKKEKNAEKIETIILFTEKSQDDFATHARIARIFLQTTSVEYRAPTKKLVSKDLILSALEMRLNQGSGLSEKQQTDTIREIDEMFLEADKINASDIHILGAEKGSCIKFRINGDLELYKTERSQNEIFSLVCVLYSNLAAADGTIEGTAFDEKKKQDGLIYRNINNKRLGARIASHYTTYKDKSFKMVLRVLGEQGVDAERIPFNKLGFMFNQSKLVEQSVYGKGITLIIGETNSGKSVTLANMLMKIYEDSNGRRHIISLENPIERTIKGVVQISIAQRGSSSESLEEIIKESLKYLMRADPNDLALAEIRDKETVDTAINMANSGHPVFSTMHVEEPVNVVERMIALGANANILSSSNCIKSIVAQKLLQKICPKCAFSIHNIPKHSDLTITAIEQISSMGLGHKLGELRFRNEHSKGCTCRNGLVGRMLIAEVMPITPEIMNLLVGNKKMEAKKLWLQETSYSIQEIALTKSLMGLVDTAEVIKELGALNETYKFRKAVGITLPRGIYGVN